MKIKAKQYATSLFESIKDKNETKAKEIIENFANILINNNDISKLGEIIKYFKALSNKEESIIEAELISAKKIDSKMVGELEKFIIKQTESKKIVMRESEDSNLLGGVILRYGDKSLDLSLRNKLNKFKKQIIN